MKKTPEVVELLEVCGREHVLSTWGVLICPGTAARIGQVLLEQRHMTDFEVLRYIKADPLYTQGLHRGLLFGPKTEVGRA